VNHVTTRFRCEPITSKVHRDWVKSLGCGICRDPSADPHHVTSRGAGGGDETVVNLCRQHHTEFHNTGRWTFQEKYGVDLTAHALQLARRSPDPKIRAAVA
jgi:hypothetical protein